MELDTQQLINELLEQNKQATLQLSIAKVMIASLQAEIVRLGGNPQQVSQTPPAPQEQPAE